jgi:catechol 2,3-dioxygenase-like lactoylglutathione lyase family enzyme
MIRFIATTLILAAAAVASVGAQPRQPAPAGDVVGVGNFGHIVANVDNSLAFYRDVLGLEVQVQPTSFARNEMNEAIMKMGATEGGQSRIAVLKVPGLALGIELIEYKDIAREPQKPHFKDPGAANMSFRVHGLDAVFPKIAKFPGVKILTAGGKPATLETPNGTLHAVFVQDPDGFVVEMLDVANPPAGSPSGFVLSGGSFEATVANSEESVKFYRDMLGFDMKLGARSTTTSRWRRRQARPVRASGRAPRRSRALPCRSR